ncbi:MULTISPECIES: hypothetical protein [Pseudoalteromonas]|nr:MULTISPECIES: hypothetical protein [Pseudoalteromonas]MBB1404347.1 hypothetical protein [Pseudoalteromonas sp. SG44-5]MBH0093435.1 hypothetical protein [Pseudoalteromonas sp. SCQQ13]MBO7927477.1 hypothetical protein [Pseudoalteromonas sp. K222D]MCK8103899.1 hypothetical protein [Pseudoalteromonas sp. 2CM36K]NYR10993.1 hypothetical protein [Pseudoalteromonas sp. MIP2626]
MNINATLYGQFVIIFALIMGALCYYVARRKMQKPAAAGLLGAVLSLIPIFSVIYLFILLFKKDVGSASAAVSE